MCCLLTLLVFLGPRIAILFWWLTDNARFALLFGDAWILPLLAFFFLPWTLLIYIAIFPLGGVAGFDWVWLGLGLLFDVGSWGGGGAGGRRQMQSSRPSSTYSGGDTIYLDPEKPKRDDE
jgi:hypothetical protein